MTRMVAIAVLTLLSSAAAAANGPPRCTNAGCAEVFHWVCTWAHAWKLAAKAGDPEALARRALRRCQSHEAVLARFKTPEDMKARRAEVLSERVGTINERRAMLAKQEVDRCSGF
jgi:hypothetical protein